MNEGPERIDYRETSDVTEVHAAIKREHRDPSAEVTPIPLWLTAICGVAVCWAGAYLGVFHGGFSSSIYNEYDSSPSALFPLPTKTGATTTAAATLTLAQQGKAVYANCVTCHQANGLGLPGQFPPLVKSEWVVGGEKRLIAILLKGLQGPLNVEGKVYNGVMPPWEKTLSDRKIAAIASYIRSEWGNAAPEIGEGKVAAARKEFEGQSAAWTEAQLLQIPADANFPEVAGTSGPAPATGKAEANSPAPAPIAPASSAAAPMPADASTPANPAPTAAPATSAVPDPAVLAQGKQVYMTVCFACHQPTGLGLPPVFPPLTKSEYINGSEERLAAMILKGNAGPMTVDGKAYNNIMPGQEATLSDEKIAAVMTYVRSSFGNSAPMVSPQTVAAVRQKYQDRKMPWTEPELKAFEGNGGAPTVPETPVSTPATPMPVQPPVGAPAPPAPSPAAPVTPPADPPASAPATPAAPAPMPPTPPTPVPPPATPVPAPPALGPVPPTPESKEPGPLPPTAPQPAAPAPGAVPLPPPPANPAPATPPIPAPAP